ETINEKVSRILRVKFKAGLFDKKFIPDTAVLTSEKHKKLALEMAEESIVLLKNQGNLLPLSLNKLKTIALIGPNAAVTRVGGGGSSRVNPYYSISPLEGIQKMVGNRVKLLFAQGDELRSWSFLPVGANFLRHEGTEGKGLKAEFYTNDKLEGKAAFTRVDSSLYFNWEDDPPAPGIGKDNYSVRWTGTITPPETRTYTFYTASDDGVRLFIDGKQIISNWTDHGTTVDSGKIDLVKGKPSEIKVEYYENGGSAVMMMGWDLPVDKIKNTMIAEAVEAARTADIAIVFAGTSDSFESEGFDRTGGLKLPGSQDELIKAVAEANPKTIVVLNTGTAVITGPWLGKVPALLEAFFPGQEGGNAVAEILFGKQNPCAKLPFSFISGYDQTPAYKHYMDKDLDAPYAEGIFVGYRYLEKNKLIPTFPFGFGLSYTTFEYSGLKVETGANNTYKVSLTVKNTGKLKGSEVVQLYIGDDHSKVHRPIKELKGFARVSLEPGQEKKVIMTLNSRSFSYYDTAGKKWKYEPGSFEIMAGSSSADIRLRTKLMVK
ncbi:MAG: glycoside hydrolase family 3 C-terminal domain-containing protein, partial [Bacteroidetes bacterium]|nr:glycoside hydrolase family 3 C-terminal domain-containing protein [Bacteroidota bacterium]